MAERPVESPPAPELLPFQRLQVNFAAHIRDPEGVAPPPGLEPRRMAIYARVFYNNVEGLLANVFSGLRGIVGERQWHALVRDFVRRHAAESPYFSHIPEEFLEYLSARRGGPPVPPFAAELCHYQWVRFALRLAPDAPGADTFDDNPIGLDDTVGLSPLAWPLRYAYPVTRLSADCQPAEPPAEATYLIAYRNRRDEVRFMASNAVTTRLLQLVDQGFVIRRCLSVVGTELGLSRQRIEHAGLAILTRLHEHDVVVHAPPNSAPRKMDKK